MLAAAAALAAVSMPLLSGSFDASAQDFDSGARIDKVGWWNRAEGATDTAPPNPLTPNIPNSPIPTNSVPEDAIAVGAQGGADKVAAVNIVLNANPGASVDTLVLTLTEITASLASTNHEDGGVVACIANDFWPETFNGEWSGRPTANCSAGRAPGQRADDGTWTFDLTAFGDQLLGAASNGVVLLPTGTLGDADTKPDSEDDAPDPFQVSFGGTESDETPQVAFSASGGSDSDPFGGPATTTTTTTFAPPSSGGGVTSGPTFSPPVVSGPGPATVETTPASDPAPAAPTTEPVPAAESPQVEPAVDETGNTTGNITPALLLGIVAIAALFFLLSLGLGPMGEPEKVHARRGAVTRTLERQGIGVHTD